VSEALSIARIKNLTIASPAKSLQCRIFRSLHPDLGQSRPDFTPGVDNLADYPEIQAKYIETRVYFWYIIRTSNTMLSGTPFQ
jgi:hypothetical protein